MYNRNTWFIKPHGRGLIEIANIEIIGNKGKFTTYAGFNEANILICQNEEHHIIIKNVEPATIKENTIEGWAEYTFEFLGIDNHIINLYEQLSNTSHPINGIKALRKIIEHYR